VEELHDTTSGIIANRWGFGLWSDHRNSAGNTTRQCGSRRAVGGRGCRGFKLDTGAWMQSCVRAGPRGGMGQRHPLASSRWQGMPPNPLHAAGRAVAGLGEIGARWGVSRYGGARRGPITRALAMAMVPRPGPLHHLPGQTYVMAFEMPQKQCSDRW